MANPTTNYSFAMPTNTDLVKDLPADFEVFGQAVDTQMKTNADAAIAKSLVTTKGDLIAATGASTPARLAVGATNGQVLTVDSAETTGMKWATPAGGGTNYTLLNTGGTATTSGSSVTVSGISGQDKLFIRFRGVSTTAAFQYLYIRLNGDTGSNYYEAGVRSNTENFVYSHDSNAGTVFTVGRMGDTTPYNADGGLHLWGCNSSGIKTMNYQGGGLGNDVFLYSTNGYYNSSSTISSVTILTTGTFDAGTIYVYGSAN